MPPKKKKPKTKKHYKQKPVPGTNRLIDLVTPALPPGWRISERTGKPYFENRENRSDTAAEIAAFVPKPKKPKTANPKKKTTAKKTTAKAKKPAAPKKTTAPILNKINPYQKPGDFVCDGKIKAAWKNRYAAFKRGNGNMPHRLKCESTGDIYMGDSPDYCRLRLNHKDDHCIWFTGYKYYR